MSEPKPEYTTEEIVQRAFTHKSQCGIYFLVKDDQVVYVGQSVNIPARLEQHKREKDFNRYFFIECHEDDLDELEYFYINKFKPPLNKVFGKKTKKLKPFLKNHPVFSKFQPAVISYWMRLSGLEYEKAWAYNKADFKTFGSFYRWIKREYPRLEEKQILPGDVARYFGLSK